MPRARKLGQGDPRHTLQVATRPYLGRARNKGDNMVEMGEEIIRVEEVYKIFGPQPRGRAFDLVRSGVGKNEVHARTGHVVGLNDVNFDVKKGEIFVVMGLSGSGKSTAIRTVNKLLDTTHGQVVVDGTDVQKLDGTVVDGTDVQKLDGTALQEFRREMTGMVFQHFALFPHRTVIDNVGYGLKVQGVEKTARDDASIKALSLVGLEAYAHYSPSQLSGGMQQRVGLARALAADPPILLMDEAFSALDPLIRRQMQDEMMEIQNELHKTTLFITHDLNEALRIGDRVCIMKDGEVVQIGTPEEILTEPATGYVAEFVQDVDQGRVIEVHEIMVDPQPTSKSVSLGEALTAMGDRAGSFVLDADGKLVGNLDPRHIMEEMGRVESLIDNFEREVFM